MSKNRYGVDTAYFKKELASLSRSLPDRTPQELRRYLVRLADVACDFDRNWSKSDVKHETTMFDKIMKALGYAYVKSPGYEFYVNSKYPFNRIKIDKQSKEKVFCIEVNSTRYKCSSESGLISAIYFLGLYDGAKDKVKKINDAIGKLRGLLT